MTQALKQHLSAPLAPQAKLRGSDLFTIAIGVVFFLDLVHKHAGVGLVKILVYSGVSAVAVVMLMIATSRMTSRRSSTLSSLVAAPFIVMALIAFVIWCATPHFSSWTTILLNPSFSIVSWMIPAAVICASGQRPAAIEAIRWPALTTLMLALAFSYAMNILGTKIYTPAIVLFCAYLSLRRDTPILITTFVAAACFLVMLSEGYRTYSVAVLILPFLRIMPLRYSTIITMIIGIIAIPFMYYAIISSGWLQATFGASDLTVDTRTTLVRELFSSLTAVEAWFGRGLEGRYISIYFYEWANAGGQAGDFYQRMGVEIGWLNLILKFGYLGLALFLLIPISAIFSYCANRRRNIPGFGDRDVTFTIFMLLVFALELPHAADFGNILWLWCSGCLLRRPLQNPPNLISASKIPATSKAG